MKRIALFPGSFDPFTKGHEEVVRKALNIVDEVIVAIGHNSGKSKRMFEIENCIKHIQVQAKRPTLLTMYA